MSTSDSDPLQLVCDNCWKNVFSKQDFSLLCIAIDHGAVTAETDPVIKYALRLNEMTMKCEWCSLVAAVMPHDANPELLFEFEMSKGRNRDLRLVFWEENAGEKVMRDPYQQPKARSVAYRIYAPGNGLAASLVSLRPNEQRVNIAYTSSQINRWLQDCKAHKKCITITDGILPARLIEVAPAKHPDRPRILPTPGHHDCTYAALSYVWGARPHDFCLQKSNLKLWEAGFELSILPQTFQDAVNVARIASLSYLWIDALCIVQNDPEDKAREIAKMMSIYGNSAITIVAASASSALDGFLTMRAPLLPSPHDLAARLPIRMPSGKIGIIWVHYAEDLEYNEALEPINQRAWTLQEQLLSKRFLYYASHTLQYRCQEGTVNFGASPHYALNWGVNEIVQHRLQDFRPSSTSEALERWLGLVKIYSVRNMTLPGDKLIAIAGVAQKFIEYLGPAYFAGIWEKHFLQQLCWGPQNESKLTRPRSYRAPSWSWASIDGDIQFVRGTYKGRFDKAEYGPCLDKDARGWTFNCSWTDFIECRTYSADTNAQQPRTTNANISGGYLRLRTTLVRAWLLSSPPHLLWLHPTDPSLAAAETAYFEHKVRKTQEEKAHKDLHAESASNNIPFLSLDLYGNIQAKRDIIIGGEDASPAALVWCLPLYESRGAYRNTSDDVFRLGVSVGGLLLQQQQKAEKNGTISYYQRVGSFSGADRKAFHSGGTGDDPEREEIVII